MLSDGTIAALKDLSRHCCVHFPYAADGDIVKASVMAVSWGADHRVLDGAAVATLNSCWKQYLEEPERLLLKLV